MSLLSDLIARLTQPAPQWAPGAAPPTGPRMSDMVKGVVESAKTPGDAYNKGMTTNQMINAGNDFALNFGTMGSLVPKPTNSLGMFGGRLAKTADLDALHNAVKLERAGATPESIWESTGWGRGADGKWRFEIDDTGAKFSQTAKDYLKASADDPTAQAFSAESGFIHPKLYEAYPQLGKLKVQPETGPNLGAFHGDTITVQGNSPTNMSRIDSTMLHELQHGVQDIEGWATGNSAQDPYTRIVEEYMKNYDTMTALDMADKLSKADRYKLYHNSAGEVEARNTQKRMYLNDQQRRSRPFWNDEDVPRKAQLILGVRK